jgi:hypothetical protein
LLATVRSAFSGPLATTYARAIRSVPWRPSGPLTAGATIAGFRITEFTEPAVLTLEGQHLFSRYALSFALSPHPTGGSRLAAESRAEFPGPHGAAYRLLVISSGFHARGVRHLLTSVRRAVPPAPHG